MPVDSRHAQYSAFLGRWQRCRDAAGGSDAVKARRTAYLPMLEGMSPASGMGVTLGIDPVDPATGGIHDVVLKLTPYDAYLQRAMFYPATGRTVLGLIGLLFGKPPTPPKPPEQILKQFDDVTLQGTSLHGFAIEMAREILITGRVGVWIDYPNDPIGRDDDRPYWSLYQAEDITNWRVERIGGRLMLTMVVLREHVEAFSADDEFATVIETRYRVLRLAGGVYSVQTFHQNPDNRREWIGDAVIVPLRRGEALNFIPFQFCGPTTLSADPEHPPLVDLVDVNLSHYRTSADREHGAHFTALPTPYITGHTLAEGEQLGVGSGTAWVLPNENASAGMVEFSGAGLSALKDVMEEKRLLMATLGARMLETQKNVQEAAQTVMMRHAGEGSALGIMADTLGKALTNLVAWHLYWAGMDREAINADHAVTVNPELLENLTTEDIAKLVAAWQAGAISKKTLYYNLQWAEWTRPGVTFDEEQADINREEDELEPPPALPQPGDDNEDEDDDA